MKNKIEIYKTSANNTEIVVHFDADTVWLNRHQISALFNRDIKTIGKHVNSVFKDGELPKESVVANFATTAADGKIYQVEYYNLDVIISVGYRVKSQQGTQFRQWATQRLKDYLVQGYAINEKRLAQKHQEVEYLKAGIRIVGRAIENATDETNKQVFELFSKGLGLLDDYDHEELDSKGKTTQATHYPEYKDYMSLIHNMYSDFESDVFAQPKDESFKSSIGQIRQSFGGVEIYPSLEEKAANLLYLITKNHSFVDGNKRIAAACFVYFLEQNNALLSINGEPIISNDTLAALTLFIATSKPEESEIVKRLAISILNRNKANG
ncbi:MAG: virulence protein RhuM/Fic/DOC family protein [Spirochaetes bacterium]|nr:virulence protein RhuM/Fic/DOC family protein [Spirochaetota bacterium]MBL7005619.1 virulence protein RhuM/Fic/DOC family protein [Spirochaetia bacterium]